MKWGGGLSYESCLYVNSYFRAVQVIQWNTVNAKPKAFLLTILPPQALGGFFFLLPSTETLQKRNNIRSLAAFPKRSKYDSIPSSLRAKGDAAPQKATPDCPDR